MGEGRDVGGEFGGVVVDPRARRKEARHQGRPGRRAEGARAIGAVEHDAVAGESRHMGRAGLGMAVDREERRRHLVGHDEKDVGRVSGHRIVPRGGGLGYAAPAIGSSARNGC